ncbi:MAG: alpha/beta hydrolase [Treponema sp.]|jgi:pimeloyl-ACP methyl ester carboxylesterase|nr:alpha/beta hydrolase [Treponema sp.]
MKKVLKIIGITLLSVIGVLLICLAVIAVNSPGKLEQLKDKEGNKIVNSLAEKQFIEIGGIQQGFFLRSENSKNPVILFLHGGPGSPELALLYRYEIDERLEKYFTVCYWDQRGAGMSFSNSIDTATMTLEQMIEDTHQITEYLKHRFSQERIYLMGHSWGSFLGIKTIEKHPENYLGYIGIGQVTNQLKSEKLAYDYMLQHAMDINDKPAVRNLKKFNKDASDFPTMAYIGTVRSQLMNKYGIGIMHDNFSMPGLIKGILFFKGYTLSEKVNCFRGMLFSLTYLWDSVVSDDLFESSNSFQVPVYIIHGKYDYQVSHTLAREYIEIIEAPDKSFFTFEKSAHSPNGEEPEKFVQIVRNIFLQLIK